MAEVIREHSQALIDATRTGCAWLWGQRMWIILPAVVGAFVALAVPSLILDEFAKAFAPSKKVVKLWNPS